MRTRDGQRGDGREHRDRQRGAAFYAWVDGIPPLCTVIDMR